MICFYLNVGILDNRKDWLNFGTGSASWWEVSPWAFQAGIVRMTVAVKRVMVVVVMMSEI